ncbi:MAG: hypothetical protein VXV86_06720, partial [Verrucomicrobiota bacterium]|nr:hypothetical protein [Verrucomicrobiota bacterium]
MVQDVENDIDPTAMQVLVEQIEEIKLEIVRTVAGHLNLASGTNAALARMVDVFLKGRLSSSNMLQLTMEVFRDDPLVRPEISPEDSKLLSQKKLLLGVGDGPSSKFIKLGNLILNAAAPTLKDQFATAMNTIFDWRLLCHHDSGMAPYINLQNAYARWYDKMIKDNRDGLKGCNLTLEQD